MNDFQRFAYDKPYTRARSLAAGNFRAYQHGDQLISIGLSVNK